MPDPASDPAIAPNCPHCGIGHEHPAITPTQRTSAPISWPTTARPHGRFWMHIGQLRQEGAIPPRHRRLGVHPRGQRDDDRVHPRRASVNSWLHPPTPRRGRSGPYARHGVPDGARSGNAAAWCRGLIVGLAVVLVFRQSPRGYGGLRGSIGVPPAARSPLRVSADPRTATINAS